MLSEFTERVQNARSDVRGHGVMPGSRSNARGHGVMSILMRKRPSSPRVARPNRALSELIERCQSSRRDVRAWSAVRGYAVMSDLME